MKRVLHIAKRMLQVLFEFHNVVKFYFEVRDIERHAREKESED